MRLSIAILAAVIGMGLASAPAAAGDYKPGYKKYTKKYAGKRRKAPRVAGYTVRGGYAYGFQGDRYIPEGGWRRDDGSRDNGTQPDFRYLENRVFDSFHHP